MGLIFNGNGDVIKAVDGSLTVEGLDLDSSSTNINAGIVTGTSANFTGNVSVGGVLTYEDVKNVDSVGIVTAREGVKIPDGKNLTLGTDGDVGIKHQSGHFEINNATGNTYFQTNGQIRLRGKHSGSTEEMIIATAGSSVDLYYDNSKKFETNSGGINVDGKAIIDGVDVTVLTNGATNNGIFLNAGDTGAGNRPYIDLKGAGTSALSGKALRVYYDNGGTESFYVDYEGNISGKDITISDKIIHSGDTNTQIRFPAADTITAETGGSERLRITSTGQLLLGINNAVSSDVNFQLHSATSGTGPIFNMTNDSGDCRIFFGQDSSGSSANAQGQIRYNVGSNYLSAYTSGSERFRIASDGKIGITESSPACYGIHASQASQSVYYRADSGSVDSIYGSATALGYAIAGTTSNHAFTLWANNAERARITAGGDLGVGNNSPNCRLAVKDVAEHTAYNSVTPSVGDCMVQLYNNPPNETANDHSTIQFGVNGGSHNRVNTISAVAESAGNRKMAFTFCTDEAGSRTEKMRITGDGKVNIGGDYTQTSYQLSVTDTGGNLFRIKTANEGDYDLRFMIQNSESNIWHYGTDDFVFGNRYDRKLHFITNGSKRLTINGNLVGINNTAPAASLHLGGPSEIRLNNAADGGNWARIRCFEDGSNNHANLAFHVGSGEAIRIKNDGDVLIPGTQTQSDQSGKLDIYHTAPDEIDSPHIRLWGPTNQDARIEFGSETNSGEGGYIMYNDGDEGLYIGSRMGTYSEVNLCTGMGDGSPTSNKRLTIDSSGRVTKPDQPRASVLISTQTQIGNSKVTAWSSPTINVGSFWDTSNKRFVAPIAGVYMFGGNFRIGAPGHVRVIRFNLQVYNSGGTHYATYGGGIGGAHNYDDSSSGWDHPYVCFTNMIQLSANDYVELHTSELAVQHTTYIQTNSYQSGMWGYLLM